VIKIGYMVALSGGLASSTTSALPTAQAWAKWVNANGGLAGGHQVQIVSADSMGTATGGQAAVQTLVQQDGVDALLMSDPVAEYSVYAGLAKDNIAVLDGSGYGPFWHTTPNFFDTSTDSTATQSASAPAGKAAGATVMAIAACSEVASCAQGAQAVVPVEKANGLQSSGVVTVSSTATDYTSQCLAFKQAKTDFVFLAVAPAGGAHLVSSCIQQGYKGLFGANASSFDPALFGSIKGLTMVGALNAFPWWINDPAVATFRSVMQQYAPGVNYRTSEDTAAWTSLQLLRQALSTKSGDVSRASVLSAMYGVKNETLGGLLAQPVTYTAGQPAAAVNCFWQFKFVAGQQDPTVIAPAGTPGNGASGDLATACLTPAA
jgi:branched-chain amino acid transport system substrate-binding protein